MSDQKAVALEIHVTNFPSDAAEPQRDGDDAHEAMLSVFLPSTLTYSALRPYNATVCVGTSVTTVSQRSGNKGED